MIKMKPGQYLVNWVDYALQGEGLRAGIAHIFVRFAGCNVRCGYCSCIGDEGPAPKPLSARQIAERVGKLAREAGCSWVCLTGGEPLLQVDAALIAHLRHHGFKLSLETNGTKPVPAGFDHVAVSPKAGRKFALHADEVRMVLKHGEEVDPGLVDDIDCDPRNWFISPVVVRKGNAQEDDRETLRNIEWCVEYCERHPGIRLSCQQHRLLWGMP